MDETTQAAVAFATSVVTGAGATFVIQAFKPKISKTWWDRWGGLISAALAVALSALALLVLGGYRSATWPLALTSTLGCSQAVYVVITKRLNVSDEDAKAGSATIAAAQAAITAATKAAEAIEKAATGPIQTIPDVAAVTPTAAAGTPEESDPPATAPAVGDAAATPQDGIPQA